MKNMATTTTYRTGTLAASDGAEIYYEVRGSGPVLLLMPGGPADATTFRKMENDLAADHTVVTYDPRGLSHSTMGELDDSRMVEVFADDAHRLLKKVADNGKASIYASSGGATISLELAKRHGDEIDTLIVHEPPTPAFMPDPAAVHAGMEDVSDTFATAGLWPAMQKFMTLIGIPAPPPPEGEPTPQQREAQAMMMRNMDFFIGRYVRNISRYEPDVKALKGCSCRIVPAVGETSKGQLAHNGGLGLARALGTDAVVFPGSHGGFDEKPVEFAARIREVIAGQG
jgi:pimeloyl-ACP methyl ester carboxylesterase